VKWSDGRYNAAFQLPLFLSQSPSSVSPHNNALHTGSPLISKRAKEQNHIKDETDAHAGHKGGKSWHVSSTNSCSGPWTCVVELFDDHSTVRIVLRFWRPERADLVTPVPVITIPRLLIPTPHNSWVTTCCQAERHQQSKSADAPYDAYCNWHVWKHVHRCPTADEKDQREGDEYKTRPKRPEKTQQVGTPIWAPTTPEHGHVSDPLGMTKRAAA